MDRPNDVSRSHRVAGVPPHERRAFIHQLLIPILSDWAERQLAGRGAQPGGPALPPGDFGPTGNLFTGAEGVARWQNLARGTCPAGTRRFPDGHCHTRAVAVLQHGQDSQGALPGGDPFVDADLTGAGMPGGVVPFVETRTHRSCLPGMVLGPGGLCYRTGKGGISNSQRLYPRGTRPLGTPGEMACLRKAASFGKRMESTVKRMQKIGVLKKPAKRSAPPRRAPLQLPPGSPSIINVE